MDLFSSGLVVFWVSYTGSQALDNDEETTVDQLISPQAVECK